MINAFYIKRLRESERYEKHKEILYLLLEMTKENGAILNPIKLGHAILDYLREKNPQKVKNNFIEQARNAALVYAFLCNEFRLMVKYQKVRDDFFVTPARWEYFLIGRKMRENSIKLLKEMSWIDCRKQIIRRKPIVKEIMFTINVGVLFDLMEKIKAHREKCSDEEWAKELERIESVKKLNSAMRHNDDDDFPDSLEEFLENGWFF